MTGHKMNSTRNLTTLSRVVGLLVTALVLLVSRSSFADESKSYVGSGCRQIDSRDGQIFSSTFSGSIRNVGSISRQVVCPVIKTVPDQGQIPELYVYTNLGTQGRVTCDFNVYTSALPGTLVQLLGSTHGDTGLGSGTPANPMNLGSSTLSIPAAAWGTASASSSWSYYELLCMLDPGTEIKSYRVNETGTRSETKKTYPPSMCHATDETTAEFYQIGGRLQTQPIVGIDNGHGVFVCPILNDRMSNNSGITVDLSFGPPLNAGQPASCSLYSTTATGVVQALSNWPSVPVGVEVNGNQPSVNHRFTLGATANTQNRYYLVCTMSASGDAKILSYRVEELGTTADPDNADGKVYPGATCQGEPHLDPTRIVQKTDGSAGNPSTTTNSSLYCPIITDHYGSTAGLSIARAYIKRGPSSGATYCTSYIFDPTGTQQIATGHGHTSDPPTGSVDEQVNMPLASSPSNARYYIECNLAPGSRLMQYLIQER